VDRGGNSFNVSGNLRTCDSRGRAVPRGTISRIRGIRAPSPSVTATAEFAQRWRRNIFLGLVLEASRVQCDSRRSGDDGRINRQDVLEAINGIARHPLHGIRYLTKCWNRSSKQNAHFLKVQPTLVFVRDTVCLLVAGAGFSAIVKPASASHHKRGPVGASAPAPAQLCLPGWPDLCL
jgi:hypothetical protein